MSGDSQNGWAPIKIMPSLVASATESRSRFFQLSRYSSRAVSWVKKGSLAVLDQGLISGSNFLISILLARWLVPEAYGAYALGFSIFLFLSGFHNALILEPMSVFGPASHRKCLRAYVEKLFGLHFVLTFFLVALLAVAIAILARFKTEQHLISVLFGVCIVTPLILFFWLARRAAYLKLAPAIAAGAATLYCLLAIALLLLTRKLGFLSGFTAFAIQSAAAVAAALVLLAHFRSEQDSEPAPSTSAVLNEHWRYGRWAIGTQFVYWLSGNAYYAIAAAFLQMQDLATLRALQNFSLPFGQFVNAISLLLLPWSAARFAEEGAWGFSRRIGQITLMFTTMASAYYAVLCFSGRAIVRVLYAGRYVESAHLLLIVAAPVVLLAASQGSIIALQAMQSPADIFFAYTISSVVTVVAGIPLTRWGGLAGATVGILISYVAFFIVISHRCRMRLKRHLLPKPAPALAFAPSTEP